MEALHHPVLLAQALEVLNIKPDGIYVDGTFGRGGHSQEILERLGERGRLLAFDKDPEAIDFAAERFANEPRFTMHAGSFADLDVVVTEFGWRGKIDGILLDLGVSSPQLDDAERGFSFQKEGPLDMRMNPQAGISASEWLAKAPEKEIADVLWQFGEERFSRRIARNIVAQRSEAPLTNTVELAELVSRSVSKREKGKHPATRSFQAIRIFINRELEDLQRMLPQAIEVLAVTGRLAVISFHSLEDRIVKRFIRDEVRGPQLPPDLPIVPEAYKPRLRSLGKPIRANEDEIQLNVRARSAMLRVAERLS